MTLFSSTILSRRVPVQGRHIATGQATAYADVRAIRRAVLPRLTTFERASLWRWCIGVAVAYAGLFALLAILVLATHASL
jgi:hypothetical protein